MRKKAIVLGIAVIVGLGCFKFASDAMQKKNAYSDCTIIQCADESGNQAMFYLISHDGELIVVDGGWVQNEDQVRRAIANAGGKVSSWILTHPHSDHIGAFNQIWQDPGDIEIEQVYVPEIDYDVYKERAKKWDDFEVYETFLEITEGDERIAYLHTGDELELAGLQMKVLNAYDEDVVRLSNELGNDDGIMFKLTNRDESILFCADVGIDMSDKIMEEFASDLPCDYVQMGHHGNGGLSEEFYRSTKAKVALFDAPEWLMNPEPGAKYTTPQNRAIMESMGAEILYYNTAPNILTLK